MSAGTSTRLLPIGEFSAATQLSPKALRLYDEQKILQPARTDPLSGYRYYGVEQVALGRLIRTLRDMDLPLAEVARVVHAQRRHAEQLLNQFSGELDRRYARQRRALQTALLQLRGSARNESLRIEQRARPTFTASVWPFTTDRLHFYEHLAVKRAAAQAALAPGGVQRSQVTYCRLIDPLSEEEARVELLLPLDTPAVPGTHVSVRLFEAAPCAAIDISESPSGADFGAPVDALFDWFDRQGCHASDVPWLAQLSNDGQTRTEILWAYQLSAVSQP